MMHTCTKHQPGSLSCHRHHACRCDACATEVRRARKRSRAGLTALTDATLAKAHIARLMAAGHTASSIARAAGLDPNVVHHLHNGGRRTRPDVISAILGVRKPDGYVASAGTARRLHALAAMGWPLRLIGERLGVGETTVSHWAHRPRVATDTASKVSTLYRDLWDEPGPSAAAQKRARARGWAPPAAWDDGTGPHGIDNPDATPHPWKRTERKTSRTADLIDLIQAGATWAEITRDRTPASIQRALHRAGRSDLYLRVRPAAEPRREQWKDVA